ncbi:MAG: hypothetical protein J0I06_11995 [Planctomycetes bacterium]|nr:hypothetical protein [Planctomycetota bacterium]
MRPFTAALLVAFAASAASAADKSEDKARDAAVAFLKAVKAKDLDAVVKVSAVPFAYRDGDKVVVLKETDALKKWLKEKLDEVKGADKVPTELAAIHAFADIKEKIKDAEQQKTIEDVVGKDGFVAVVSADGKMIPILVRIKDGKATVVGLGR